MNPQNPDNADLTAYALGELPPDHERDLRAWIASDVDAQAELARIEQIADALHRSAPMATAKLTPQQRQNVLTPPKGPRIMTPMMPRQPVVMRRQSRLMPFLSGITKIAAVLAVAAGAFLLGKHVGSPVASNVVRAEPTKQPQPLTHTIQPKSTPVERVTPAPVVQTPMTPPVIVAKVEAAPEIKPVAPTSEPEQKPTPKMVEAAKPASAPVVGDQRGYVAVSREPIARVTIRPHETRPVPVTIKGQALASPISPAAASQPAAADKGRAPDLYIQSWKAEVASCPWNAGHKLMRVLVQLPADQPASASPANTYPLQVSFDNLTVRSYRLLSESHVRPHPGANSAAHVMWYEVIPNGAIADANRETGRSVATITVPNARFNSQTVGPFDSSKLQALDRGVKWENAREDFLFETSIVGFGLLLRGEQNLGTLNHELVLKIVEKAQGDKAADGERAKFIKLVQEAKRVTGI
jgi:Domain of unknown function (DUF3520)